MKASELRIGNRVIYNNVIDKVWGIQSNNVIDLYFNNDSVTVHDLEPIHLTEELLLNFGFYKNIDTKLFEKSGYQIDLSVLKCHFYLPSFGDWYKEIEYVHQLQNLYFALTGEELKIEL